MDQIRIGKFIAELRNEKGMTQKELSEKIGVSDRTISKWECGRGMPDLSYMDSLCDSLGISMNELISGEKLPAAVYSDKAEENIMNLMKENEKSKKGSWISILLGVVLLIISLFLVMGSTRYEWKILIPFYLDVPTMVLLFLLNFACVLLSGARKLLDVLRLLKIVAIPAGLLVAFMTLVIVLTCLTDLAALGPNIAVTVIALVYSALEYLVVCAWYERVK